MSLKTLHIIFEIGFFTIALAAIIWGLRLFLQWQEVLDRPLVESITVKKTVTDIDAEKISL